MFPDVVDGPASLPVEDPWCEVPWPPGPPVFDLPPSMGDTAPSGLFALELDHSTREPAGLSDAELVDAVIGFDRTAAWATARQYALLAEFHRRGDGEPGDVPVRAWAAQEVALAVTVSSGAAANRLAEADRFAGPLAETRALLAAGRIDAARARLICERTAVLDDAKTGEVQARVLPGAAGQTWAQLNAALRRAVLAVDAEGAAARHRWARAGRRVEVFDGDDGMATLWARLAATDATAAFEWVTRLARGMDTTCPVTGEQTKDPRGIDARRADVFTALLTGNLTITDPATGPAAGAVTVTPAPGDPVSGDPGSATRASTAPTSAGGAAGDGVSAGPAPAGPAAADTEPGSTGPATTSPAATDPDRTGAASTGAAQGDDTEASDTEASDTEAVASESVASGEAADSAAADGATSDGAVTATAAATVPGPTPRVYAKPVGADRPLIQILMPYSTMTGADDEPCELVGYGPLPAPLARDLAAKAGAVWRRIVTDPLSGAVLDVGRTSYRPPAALAEFVRARDVVCRNPRCRRPAPTCELDHVVEWQDGGVTAEHNLCLVCVRHHDLKEAPGWQVVLHEDRRLEWITPTGHHYWSRPHDHRPTPPATPPRATAPPPGPAADQQHAETDDDEPPF